MRRLLVQRRQIVFIPFLLRWTKWIVILMALLWIPGLADLISHRGEKLVVDQPTAITLTVSAYNLAAASPSQALRLYLSRLSTPSSHGRSGHTTLAAICTTHSTTLRAAITTPMVPITTDNL